MSNRSRLEIIVHIGQYNRGMGIIRKNFEIFYSHAFSKIYLDIEIPDFEAKSENIFGGFISIYDKMNEN